MFLKEMFNDYLNASGDVEIAGSVFYKDEILNTMDTDAYEQAFLTWKEERKSSLLTKADVILDTFNTQSRFRTLIQIYNRGQILPFIGAGMSMSSGYAGWTGYLYKLRHETTITEEELKKLLDCGEYEKAAQILFENMPTNAFNEALENEYHSDNNIHGTVQFLPKLFPNSIVTTNFDSVLKRCYDNENCSFSDVILGVDSEEISRLQASESKLLLKLHGKANSARKRVLTETEYDEHYSDSDILKKSIEVITSNTLLFLGCSLSVDRTIKTMIEIAEEKGLENIPRHYALIGLYDEDEKLTKRDELAKANIHPIWYDGNDDHDECIEALLLKLSEGRMYN